MLLATFGFVILCFFFARVLRQATVSDLYPAVLVQLGDEVRSHLRCLLFFLPDEGVEVSYLLVKAVGVQVLL